MAYSDVIHFLKPSSGKNNVGKPDLLKKNYGHLSPVSHYSLHVLHVGLVTL